MSWEPLGCALPPRKANCVKNVRDKAPRLTILNQSCAYCKDAEKETRHLWREERVKTQDTLMELQPGPMPNLSCYSCYSCTTDVLLKKEQPEYPLSPCTKGGSQLVWLVDMFQCLVSADDRKAACAWLVLTTRSCPCQTIQWVR
jgi:formate-dependent nitrite reductase cytochrome c552 subunit